MAYKEIDKDHYLLDYINSSYFVFHRIKTSTPVKYKYTYAFPLIKITIIPRVVRECYLSKK